ncbi:peptide-methionine (S)-S-oxide reductase MsrA [Paludibacterium yongneupense]|uniref:peptide-methionine (S)-S-oxide reductase MsrA n=1 Tax=Paludibacterium yongneupense TaxID=400061 RepID=UPI0004157B2A|nr:peptide-methionine (S)-S-oxide reductase MsrA [Paludibacterium yongneupense]
MELATAYLAGGCFWCLEAIFTRVAGVEEVTSGYTGGTRPDPDYGSVCTGATGHAETVRLRFDPRTIPFRELLDIFFTIHDPTTLNQQGHDVGTQYRSAIFYIDDEQHACASELIAELNAKEVFNAPIVTELSPATTFYPAEDEHHRYFEHHGSAPYCRAVIAPKLKKFLLQEGSRLKP